MFEGEDDEEEEDKDDEEDEEDEEGEDKNEEDDGHSDLGEDSDENGTDTDTIEDHTLKRPNARQINRFVAQELRGERTNKCRHSFVLKLYPYSVFILLWPK